MPDSAPRTVEIFFYGLFMDVELLRQQALVPRRPRRAFVDGFEIRIGARASLVPAAGGRAYGMLMALPAPEIARLYRAPGLERYLPEAILARTMEGEAVPALCYNLAEPPGPSERNEAYAARLRAVLSARGFPEDYVASVR
ncbi:MAG TPA: gamma-glutamylcyclotransferase family protein [Candidatus Polarisedimenticolia bacterium]|jgi:hypothetical protein|nr:gamma-glutamylcyclotransferase family protein [Candidatus Polarisedimenticolia bacterium]